MKKSSTPICFILNPAADKSRSAKYEEWLQAEAEKRWTHFEVVLTHRDLPVKELAAKKSQTCSILVACGGDGTVHQVINGIACTGTGFAVLPIGTGNDFAKSLHLPSSYSDILDLIQMEKFINADLIRFEGDAEGWCVNTLGIGLDGLANYYSKSYIRLKGYIIYVLGAVKAAFTFRGANFTILADGTDLSNLYLMATFCNGQWEGGTFNIAPDADLSDGIAELVTVKKISIAKILIYLISFKNGPAKWMTALQTNQFSEVQFSSDKPVSAHADGEHLGNSIRELRIRVVEEALPVITGH